MKDARKVAIARFVLRNKEHLAAIRPMDDVLTMATMRFHDEVTSPQDLDGEVFEEKPKKPEKRELDMAKQLIESLDQRLRCRQVPRRVPRGAARPARAEGRGQGDRQPPRPRSPKPTKAPDLMAALEESLAAVRGDEAETDGKAQVQAPGEEPPSSKSSASKSSTAQELLEARTAQEEHLAQEVEGQGLGPAPEVARKAKKRDQEVTVGNRKLKLTNLDKVLYPKTEDHQGAR